MQTKLICTGTALLGVAGYYTYLNYHYALTGSMYISGIVFIVFAALKKDKKDKQIEEIHDIATTKLKPLLVKEIKPRPSPEESKQPLSKTHEEVLNLLFKEPTEIKNICKGLNLSTEEAKYYLDDLRKIDMVSMPPFYPPGPGSWSIQQSGREYIMLKRQKD